MLFWCYLVTPPPPLPHPPVQWLIRLLINSCLEKSSNFLMEIPRCVIFLSPLFLFFLFFVFHRRGLFVWSFSSSWAFFNITCIPMYPVVAAWCKVTLGRDQLSSPMQSIYCLRNTLRSLLYIPTNTKINTHSCPHSHPALGFLLAQR